MCENEVEMSNENHLTDASLRISKIAENSIHLVGKVVGRELRALYGQGVIRHCRLEQYPEASIVLRN